MFFEKRGELFLGKFAPLFGDSTIIHGFSTRKGGVSNPPYDTLNLGMGTDDSRDRVDENRHRFFHAMSIPSRSAAIPQQVHGNHIVRITEPRTYPATDGLITDVPGIGLVVQVADCLPIYLYDPVRKVVGLVHAGWRGTKLKIVSKAVVEISRHYNVKAHNLHVFFGPSIGPCCYEVGNGVSMYFSDKYLKNGKLDLWESNRDLLIDAGVNPERIVMSRLCTVCLPEWFFSHRAGKGRTGRMMAIIGLRNKELDIEK
jgi:YfiH family protein